MKIPLSISKVNMYIEQLMKSIRKKQSFECTINLLWIEFKCSKGYGINIHWN